MTPAGTSNELDVRASKQRGHAKVILVGGAAPHGRRQVTQEGHVGRAGEHGPGERGNNGRTAWQRIVGFFGITGDWSTAALDPWIWYSTLCEGGCGFTAAWERETEEADKVEVAPGVTVASLRRFRAALIGPT